MSSLRACALAAIIAGSAACAPFGSPPSAGGSAASPMSSQAQIARDREIDRLVREVMTREHLAGLSVAIAHDGAVIYARGYGFADLARRLPATPRTVYNIASMSKQFASACILLLQQDGKLDIDDKLARFLPGFPHGDEITIREVLDHTSGLSDYLDVLDNDTLTPSKVRAALYHLTLKFRPGTRFDYSNSNYIVAGLIVERASGSSYDDFLRRRILGPLRLRSTSIGTTPLGMPEGAVGYTVVKGRTIPVDRRADSATVLDFPDGGVNSTALDLIRWDDALDTARVMNRTLLETMFAPSPHKGDFPGGYGLGIGVDSVGRHRERVHTGAWTGFTGINATLPDDRFALVMLSNTDTFDKRDLARRIIQLFYR